MASTSAVTARRQIIIMANSNKKEKSTERVPMLPGAGKKVGTPEIPPIVGIGASAGGLEALEEFFQHVSKDCGLAFVVVQHLDPSYKGMLPELLQRNTTMSVVQADNRMKVKPNCVYVIPPNKDLSILHGVLHLLEPVAPRGLRLPIDFFFRALALDQKEKVVGIVLSGMGSDGTLGMRAIKENFGLTMAQEPSSAKFDSMPRSVIDAGLVDVVASSQELPGKIFSYLRSVQQVHSIELSQTAKSEGALKKIIILLRDRTGNDFTLYKKNTLYRRIERRRGLHKIETLVDYVRYLQENPKEVDLLFKELLIGVTNFFRDPEVWEYLKSDGLPALLAAHPGGKALRAWVPACSTGEEAYSLAMVFKEVLEQVKPKGRFSMQIFATDLDPETIERARQGVYPTNIAADVSADRLSRFFIEENKGYRVSKEIREMIIFAPQNVAMDPPFTKLDILSCRNLLIYLTPELQQKIIPVFHYALNTSGILLVGNAESIGVYSDLFRPISSKVRLYQRIDLMSPTVVNFPSRRPSSSKKPFESSNLSKPQFSFQYHAEQFLLRYLSPAAVLVNADGDITYFNGSTGKYLEPAAGKANLNIYAMAREGLRYQLANALKTVSKTNEKITLEGLNISEVKGAEQIVNITVQPIETPGVLQGMVVVAFWDVTSTAATKQRRAIRNSKNDQEEELVQAQLAIKSAQEEMQTSKEELTSVNEELQSMNEELQSANEEMMTSKEEIQSLNEELQTVNAELQSKVENLSIINSDLQNLLDSAEIAIIFLDSALNVRRFTYQVTLMFKLIPADIGRPLTDIVNSLSYPDLKNDVQHVLRTLLFVEKQLSSNDGRWFKMRIMPYRTLDNVIDGVVMTFTDITSFKTMEVKLRGSTQASPTV
jgi:two-component system CheB/CheR fusion protein